MIPTKIMVTAATSTGDMRVQKTPRGFGSGFAFLLICEVIPSGSVKELPL